MGGGELELSGQNARKSGAYIQSYRGRTFPSPPSHIAKMAVSLDLDPCADKIDYRRPSSRAITTKRMNIRSVHSRDSGIAPHHVHLRTFPKSTIPSPLPSTSAKSSPCASPPSFVQYQRISRCPFSARFLHSTESNPGRLAVVPLRTRIRLFGILFIPS